GLHRKLYRFSPNDYREVARIWSGPAPSGDGALEVVDGAPEGGPVPDLAEVPEEFAPGITPEELQEIARKLASA
ncbi:MAG: manganese catalase, partial [Bacillota bacterium]